MKTAVSIPTDLFRKADRLAKRLKKSRSALYADAVREYLARHDPDEMRAWVVAYNRELDKPEWKAWLELGAQSLRRVEWTD